MATARPSIFLTKPSVITEGDELLTVKEAAAYLKVSKQMLYKRVRKNEIPYQRLGKLLRFSRRKLNEWSTPEARQ